MLNSVEITVAEFLLEEVFTLSVVLVMSILRSSNRIWNNKIWDSGNKKVTLGYSTDWSQDFSERKFRDRKTFQVMCKNRDFNKEVLDVSDKKDSLAISVRERITFTIDSHVTAVFYYAACNSSFRTGRNAPENYT